METPIATTHSAPQLLSGVPRGLRLAAGPQRAGRRVSSPGLALSEARWGLLLDLGRQGLLTAAQAHRRHFPGRSRKRVLNVLGELERDGHAVRRVWGYDPRTGGERAAWLPTLRGLRRVGLGVPAKRHRRASALQSLPHDATVVDLQERILADLRAAGVPAGWLTEAELARGYDWLPAELATERKRPDGVLVLPGGERIAVEAETSRHTSGELRAKVQAYRAALEAGVYHAAAWYFATTAPDAGYAVERALREHGGADYAPENAGRLQVRPFPPGVSAHQE
jgi:Replication-relaxation